MDKLLSMDVFIKHKIRSIYNQIRKIFRIRKYLTLDACKTLVEALVMSRLDYASSLLYNINKTYLNQLQCLQSFVACLVLRASFRESAELLRKHLHWLPVEQRINFRIVIYVFKCLHGKVPIYLFNC